MKLKNKIFLLPALLIIVAAGFPVAVKATCGCTCQPVTTEFTNPGSTTVISKPNCAQARSDVTLPDQTDLPACTAACKALPAPGGSERRLAITARAEEPVQAAAPSLAGAIADQGRIKKPIPRARPIVKIYAPALVRNLWLGATPDRRRR